MKTMVVERTENEVIIRLSANVKAEEIQAIIDFARYKEIVSGFAVTQDVVDELASAVNKTWWSENRSRLMK